MNKFYYSIGLGSKVFKYTDDYAYDINDGIERESLAICLAYDYYTYTYNVEIFDSLEVNLLDPKSKKKLYTFKISYYMEPVFEVDEEIACTAP
jgi:hypothetical protein